MTIENRIALYDELMFWLRMRQSGKTDVIFKGAKNFKPFTGSKKCIVVCSTFAMANNLNRKFKSNKNFQAISLSSINQLRGMGPLTVLLEPELVGELVGALIKNLIIVNDIRLNLKNIVKIIPSEDE
jgi:hypothetical protein